MRSRDGNKQFALIEAGNALFRAALTALPIGALTGMCAGVFFYGIGSIFGAVIGLPVGFIAALFGAAIGRRYGWVLSGAICGLLGGIAIYDAYSAGVDGIATNRGLLDFVVLLPTIAGAIAGWTVGDRLYSLHVTPKGLIGSIERQLYYSISITY